MFRPADRIEEDDEMRAAVNLYKSSGAGSGTTAGKTRRKGQFAMDIDEETPSTVAEDTEEEETDFPEVKLDELLDEFDEMTLTEQNEV